VSDEIPSVDDEITRLFGSLPVIEVSRLEDAEK
jgi:hypothetical protein